MHRALLLAVLSLSILLSPLVAAQAAEYTFTTVDIPSPFGPTNPYGINAVGQIVGDIGSSTHHQGFLIDGATFTFIDAPDAMYTVAYGINNRGQIVGFFTDATTHHGFVATPGH